MLFALFRSCVVGTWAVKLGLWLCESDSRLVCSMVNSAPIVGTCMLPSGAMVQHHGDSVKTVKMVSVVIVFLKDAAVSHAHCGRGPSMLFVCLIHARAWRCVRYIVLVVLLLIIVSFGTPFRLCVARCVLSLRFHGFRCSML